MSAAISVRGLRKSYGATEAVRGLDFEVETGEVFGLLGPNGAGKTTTVEILEGYRSRDAGTVEVLGMDPGQRSRKLRERCGIVLQECAVPPLLTVREVVEMYAGYFVAARPIDEVIELVGLREKAEARVKSLSGGQQRRLDLALGLVGDPDLIFLDEPTTGFDPTARRAAWEVIRGIRSLGKTVVLTTHYMDEAEALADRICVIAGGQVVAEGSPQALRARGTSTAAIRFRIPEGVAAEQFPLPVRIEGQFAELETEEPTAALHALTGWALQHGLELGALEVRRPTLEDVYLELTSHA